MLIAMDSEAVSVFIHVVAKCHLSVTMAAWPNSPCCLANLAVALDSAESFGCPSSWRSDVRLDSLGRFKMNHINWMLVGSAISRETM